MRHAILILLLLAASASATLGARTSGPQSHDLRSGDQVRGDGRRTGTSVDGGPEVRAPLAELRDVKDPAKIKDAFPAAAKLRVVNIWATWCVPCVAEMPELRAVDAAFGPEVALAGVSMDNMIPEMTRMKVVTFLGRQKVNYINIYYSGNADDLTRFFRFEGEIPVTIAFDRRGNELWRHQGPINRTETIAELRKLLRRMQ